MSSSPNDRGKEMGVRLDETMLEVIASREGGIRDIYLWEEMETAIPRRSGVTEQEHKKLVRHAFTGLRDDGKIRLNNGCWVVAPGTDECQVNFPLPAPRSKATTATPGVTPAMMPRLTVSPQERRINDLEAALDGMRKRLQVQGLKIAARYQLKQQRLEEELLRQLAEKDKQIRALEQRLYPRSLKERVKQCLRILFQKS
ncbi:MAG TPA: hypothetical protein VD907_00760 [Verrucomicrobiae bacterium]|nr:hypothetical protein [Verrucomicrobiae bacterium]